jgi:hypothetical protein
MTNLVPHQQTLGEALAVIQQFIRDNELNPYTKKKVEMGLVWLKFAKTYLKHIDLYIKEEYSEEMFLDELSKGMVELYREGN